MASHHGDKDDQHEDEHDEAEPGDDEVPILENVEQIKSKTACLPFALLTRPEESWHCWHTFPIDPDGAHLRITEDGEWINSGGSSPRNRKTSPTKPWPTGKTGRFVSPSGKPSIGHLVSAVLGSTWARTSSSRIQKGTEQWSWNIGEGEAFCLGNDHSRRHSSKPVASQLQYRLSISLRYFAGPLNRQNRLAGAN